MLDNRYLPTNDTYLYIKGKTYESLDEEKCANGVKLTSVLLFKWTTAMK
jgi:hypothetical protein